MQGKHGAMVNSIAGFRLHVAMSIELHKANRAMLFGNGFQHRIGYEVIAAKGQRTHAPGNDRA